MNKLRENRTEQLPRIGVGMTSLLVVFMVLCLSVTALVSFYTAQTHSRITQQGITNAQNLAAAQGRADVFLAEVDGVLAQQRALFFETEQAYYDACARALSEIGCEVDNAVNKVVFSVMVDAQHLWVCELEILPQAQAARYRVLSQTSVFSGEWEPGEYGNVWQGE